MFTNPGFLKVVPFILIIVLTTIAGCYSETSPEDTGRGSAKDSFQFRETIAENNQGVINLGSFRRKNPSDLLCQSWDLLDVDDASTSQLMFEEGKGRRLYAGISLFKDSMAVVNPREEMKIGTWQLAPVGKEYMLNIKTEKEILKYRISDLKSREMKLHWISGNDSLWMNLRTNGIVHIYPKNDPFHPSNLQWRIRPSTKEPDSMIRKRTEDCLKFYALLFRDAIKTQKTSITYGGLPSVFNWYNRGIGLDPVDEVSDAWISCFYDREDAMKSYKILQDLIVQNEFDWPRGVPSWVYSTHSVLEQMYHTLRAKK